MKNIIKTLLLAVFAGSIFTSCELELLPLDGIILENYWKDKSDVESVLSSCYYGLQESDCITDMLIWGEVRSDNVDVGPQVPEYLKHILKGNLKQTNQACDWSAMYKVINRCNTLLHYAPEVAANDPNFTPSDVDATGAEARGLRAIAYFYLLRSFKDIPFTFEASIDDSQDYLLPQTPHEQVLDALIEDIENCKTKAINRYTNDKMNSGRITRLALYALLADMYLWRASDANLSSAEQAQFYRKAIESADYVINYKIKEYNDDVKGNLNTKMDSYIMSTYGYPLIAERNANSGSNAPAAYNDIFGEGNSYESIFELTYDRGADALKNTAVANMYGNNTTGGSFTQYLTASNSLLNTAIPNGSKNYTDQQLFSVTTDYRSLTSFRYDENGTYNILKYIVNKFEGNEQDFGIANTNWKAGTNRPESYARNSDNYYNGWIIYRLTDIMLIRAEAEIELAGLQTKEIDWSNVVKNTMYKDGSELSTPEELYMDAFNIISAVYLRSNPMAQTTLASAAPKLENYSNYSNFVTLCENERQREFLFEGKRYYDLVRRARREGNTSHFSAAVSQKFGEASKAVIIKMSMMDFMYMPIAERQLDVNSLLKQNPAYILDEKIEKN